MRSTGLDVIPPSTILMGLQILRPDIEAITHQLIKRFKYQNWQWKREVKINRVILPIAKCEVALLV